MGSLPSIGKVSEQPNQEKNDFQFPTITSMYGCFRHRSRTAKLDTNYKQNYNLTDKIKLFQHTQFSDTHLKLYQR